MQGSKRISIIDLNQYITCKICKGYFVDATTIIECLHTFCRSCIVKYLENSKYCPVCDVQVHKNKPLLNIRPDKTLQDIVYKLVPRLLQNEMQRRREFFEHHPEVKLPNIEQYQHLITPEESICLTLGYHGCSRSLRYLRCPAAVSLGHLKKLIRAKYDLTDNHRIDILHNQDCLNSSLTLMDVAYIYSWKRKGPIGLTYRIYECTAKKIKLQPEMIKTTLTNNSNNNNWKEVQLRISENGEMSITGIQDSPLSPSLLEIVNSDVQYKNEVVTIVESSKSAPKKELPALKYIGKCENVPTLNSSEIKSDDVLIKDTLAVDITQPSFLTSCATLSSGTTTTVFSTINSTKCSTKTDNTPPEIEENFPRSESTEGKPLVVLNNNGAEKNFKRKLDIIEAESPVKQSKPTILNHSIGLLNLSNNHPLKKHSKLNRNGENKEVTKNVSLQSELLTSTVTATTVDVTFSKPVSFINKNICNVQFSRPGTPIMSTNNNKSSIIPAKQPMTVYASTKPPCYMPKTTYNSVINVPKLTTSASSIKPECKIQKSDVKTLVTLTATIQQQSSTNALGKLTIKSKPSTPIGYKTLRDPPKSWNSQISKANLNKPSPDPKYSDLKNVRPAKFFKMRNNMPRYLGNPASGVKPMYQVHVSPEKEKAQDSNKVEKSEIKKHSIVKIDPKTLKPISEKAPETTSLSNHSNQVTSNQNDLKINTSSVSIFNPLKLQSSPKNERKSPKSPHSPKLKTQTTNSPKREKVNLNFTPPNPFIPNLTSPTISPNQFLYPTGPPGFPPPYDPRVMAAYHSLWYGQRMTFPTSPIPGLNLDMNQRKNFEIAPSPTSPKPGSMTQPALGQASTKLPPTTTSAISTIPRTQSLVPTVPKLPPPTCKKTSKDSKNEKSLENTVEKLTQSRNKEIICKGEAIVTCKEGLETSLEGKENMDNDKKCEPTSSSSVSNGTSPLVPSEKIPEETKPSEVFENAAGKSEDDSDAKKLPCVDKNKEAAILGSNSMNNRPSNSENDEKLVEGNK